MGVRAIGLISGGPDGELACRLLEAQGLEVRRLHFRTGFARQDHAARIGTDVEVVDVQERYLREVVVRPRFGYGAGMNPCVDCRIFMLRLAKGLAGEHGAELVVTGEVVGKRSMTQTRAAMARIESESGLTGRLLRPLCARLMEPTEAERRGWIDRGPLGRSHGRSRRDRRELARRLGMADAATPSGGCCMLADRAFARRLRDRLEHRPLARLTRAHVELLRVGRHFRLGHALEAIVARNAAEGERLLLRAAGRWTAQVADGRGAVVLAEGEAQEGGIARVASLAVRYSRHRDRGSVQVVVRGLSGERRLESVPADDASLANWRL